MSNENEPKSKSSYPAPFKLSPDLQRTMQIYQEVAKEVAEAARPMIKAAAQVAAVFESVRGVMAQVAQAVRPIVESGWIEAIYRGFQDFNEALGNAEAMGQAGWTIPLNADLHDCVRLLRQAATPESADAAFVDFYLKDDKASLVLLLADLQQDEKLSDFHHLLDEIAFGINAQKYKLVVPALLALFEGVTRRHWDKAGGME